MKQVHGARLPPSRAAKCCCPSCAISGYVTGDPLEGICRGPALHALLCQLCGCGGCFATCCWKPSKDTLVGDTTQRTVKNRVASGCLLGCGAISFWEHGDLVSGICAGDAKKACYLNMLAPCVLAGTCYAMCLWRPDIARFERNARMHGARILDSDENVDRMKSSKEKKAVLTPKASPIERAPERQSMMETE
eukprot:TRINITY_DN52661_c0_g1_i1.p1 TRINITY_DN52661_c0_g1~~TRINITY_DN52661_c0_g1_i1.p1  ORF type:complete len:192 (-),score=29.06 TRINITY_DN52661_c0_g1_i1:69-644(-)